MLSKEEFIAKATTGDYQTLDNVADWTIEAAALMGSLAISGSEKDKAVLVESIQKLALRMPATLLLASSTKLKDVHEDYVL